MQKEKVSLALIKATPTYFYDFLGRFFSASTTKNSPLVAKNRPGSPDLDLWLRGLVLGGCQK
jgi:hypothetical protein